MSSTQISAFNWFFTNDDFFSVVFPVENGSVNMRATMPVESKEERFEGLAFGEPADILVLTPADDEMSYLRKTFGAHLHEVATPGACDCYCLVTQRGRSVIFARVGEGNIASSVATSRLLDLFRPKKVILLGVAGAIQKRGRHNWAIGDVVIGQTVIDYEWGKIEKTKGSWKFVPKSDIDTTWGGERFDRLLYAKACEMANNNWKLTPDMIKAELQKMVDPAEVAAVIGQVEEFIKRPSIAHIGIVGSGSKIVASHKYINEIVDKKSASINTFETEAAGVSYACCLHADSKIDYLIIRGIMDLTDGKTRNNKIRKGLRHIAKIACGRFVADLLENL